MKLLDKLIRWIVPKQCRIIPNDCRTTGYIVDGKWHRNYHRAVKHAKGRGMPVWDVVAKGHIGYFDK